MIRRAGAALILTLSMAACATETLDHDEQWEAIEGCGGEELCSYATVATAIFNKQVGKPGRKGVSTRGATTDGKVVSVDVGVPNSIKSIPTRGGRTGSQQLMEGVRKDLCSGRRTRRFFDLGGGFQFSLYLPSGEKFSTETIESC